MAIDEPSLQDFPDHVACVTKDDAVDHDASISLEAFYAQVSDGSTVLTVAINFSNAMIGAGIVGMPYALKQAGCISGLVILFSMAALSRFYLIYPARKHER